MVVGFVAIGSVIFIQAGLNEQNAEDQCTEEISLATKKKVSGEFIILQSITRYITAGYH
jgi:hypothetical protein